MESSSSRLYRSKCRKFYFNILITSQAIILDSLIVIIIAIRVTAWYSIKCWCGGEFKCHFHRNLWGGERWRTMSWADPITMPWIGLKFVPTTAFIPKSWPINNAAVNNPLLSFSDGVSSLGQMLLDNERMARKLNKVRQRRDHYARLYFQTLSELEDTKWKLSQAMTTIKDLKAQGWYPVTT